MSYRKSVTGSTVLELRPGCFLKAVVEKYKNKPIKLVNGYPCVCIRNGQPTQRVICKHCRRDCVFAGRRRSY